MCPLRFLVISAMRRLGNAQSFKTYMFRFWAFCHERDPGQAGYPTLTRLHGKLSPRLRGLPYVADRATCLGGSPHLPCKRDQNKIRNNMDRSVTPPRRVTSPSWGPPPPRKQALSVYSENDNFGDVRPEGKHSSTNSSIEAKVTVGVKWTFEAVAK